jgi:hypothetical protein
MKREKAALQGCRKTATLGMTSEQRFPSLRPARKT